MFFCSDIITNTCHRSELWIMNIRLLFSSASAVNLCGLVLDRFIAIVHPLKYITLMTRPRIIQVISFSWVLPVSFNVLKVTLYTYTFYFKTIPAPACIWLNITFLRVPTECCLNTLLCINDISPTQARSVSTHRNKAVTF